MALTEHNPTSALSAAITRTAIAELTNAGTLRVALNLSNDLLARREGTAGSFSGPAVDIARHLSGLLNVPPEFIAYESTRAACAACQRNAWDIALLVPAQFRTKNIALSRPCLLLSGAYAVPARSDIYRIAQIDRRTTRIVVERNSVHDLLLSRSLEFATLLRVPTLVDLICIARTSDHVVAADRYQLELSASTMQLRVLEEHSMLVEHAIGTPGGRRAAAALLDAYVHHLVNTGSIDSLWKLHGIECQRTFPYDKFEDRTMPILNLPQPGNT
jgi:polar amino acid transport system substrate-binding protein